MFFIKLRSNWYLFEFNLFYKNFYKVNLLLKTNYK